MRKRKTEPLQFSLFQNNNAADEDDDIYLDDNYLDDDYDDEEDDDDYPIVRIIDKDGSETDYIIFCTYPAGFDIYTVLIPIDALNQDDNDDDNNTESDNIDNLGVIIVRGGETEDGYEFEDIDDQMEYDMAEFVFMYMFRDMVADNANVDQDSSMENDSQTENDKATANVIFKVFGTKDEE